MEIIIRDASGSCPRCQGLLRPMQLHITYRCIDCNAIFQALEDGYDKNGVIMKERTGQWIKTE